MITSWLPSSYVPANHCLEGGALAPMLERILNAALDGEMDAHLSAESRERDNRRNGKMSKKFNLHTR